MAALLGVVLALGLLPGTGKVAYADQTEKLLTTIAATGNTTYSATVDGVVTVLHNNSHYLDELGWVWYCNADVLTVSACEGYITPSTVSVTDVKHRTGPSSQLNGLR